MTAELQYTEEDIKNNVVVPVLKNIGFAESELFFETYFKVRLGHKSSDSRGYLGGYSDILCKSPDQSKNYFIVEVKIPSHTLNDDDMEQAISYARLVHPIAPFAIVTNGSNTQIFDTISKRKVDEQSVVGIKNRVTIPDLETVIACRYEALVKLIGYNSETVAHFSKIQQNNWMSTLIGDATKKDRKYIPDLYCVPTNLIESFNNFLESSETVFMIIGDQGVGKTNSMCYLAQLSSTNHISFFYAGSMLSDELLTAIKVDCDWFFANHLDNIEIVKRLVGFTSDQRKLIIFIDAIDEVPVPGFIASLDKTVKHFSEYDNLKIVLSAKTQTYNRFIKNMGVPTKISENVFKTRNSVKSELDNINYSFRIDQFNDIEFKTCISQYLSFYNIKGDLPSALIDELHRGVALKIFALVFQNRELETGISFKILFTKYLEAILEQSENEQVRARNIRLLETLAQLILRKNLANSSELFAVEHIDEEEFRKAIGLNITELLPQELYDYNIFEVHTDDAGNRRIGFYYSFIRDFIILDRVLQIFTLDKTKFLDKIEELARYDLGRELVYIAYLFSDSEYKGYQREQYKLKSDSFAQHYISHFDENQIANSSTIGFRMRGNLGFAFGSLENPFNLVMYQRGKTEPLSRFYESPKEYADFLDTRIIYRLQRGGPYLLTVDPQKHAKEYFLNDCLDLIRKGRLNENECSNLSLELMLSSIDRNREIFGFKQRETELQLPDANGIPAIQVKALKEKIDSHYRKEFLSDRSFEDQLFFQKEVLKHGTETKYHTIFDRNKLIEIASLMKRPGSDYLGIHDSSTRNFSIELILHILKNYPEDKTISAIYPTYSLPNSDLSINGNDQRFITYAKRLVLSSVFTPQNLYDFVSVLFTCFIADYQKAIETNFEGLKAEFSLYAKLPVRMIFAIDIKKDWVSYIFISDSETRTELVSADEWAKMKKIDVTGIRLSDLLMPRKSYPVFGHASEWISLRCPMRNFLYEHIEREVLEILKKLKN